MKRTRKLALMASGVAMIAMLGGTGVSNAGAGAPIVAGPLAATAGYLTRAPIIIQGQTVKFTNLDVQPHDVRSYAGQFSSALIGLGKSTPVNGVSSLVPGKYGFYCSIHPNMKGNLTVRKPLK
jgi:plastocyanin